MDEKPKINVKIEEETKIAMSSSSSPNHQNNNFDDFSNQRFQNNQSNYLNNGIQSMPSQNQNNDLNGNYGGGLDNQKKLDGNNINASNQNKDSSGSTNIQNKLNNTFKNSNQKTTTNNNINSNPSGNINNNKQDIKNNSNIKNKPNAANNLSPKKNNTLKNTNPKLNSLNRLKNPKQNGSNNLNDKLEKKQNIGTNLVGNRIGKFISPFKSLFGGENVERKSIDEILATIIKILITNPYIFIIMGIVLIMVLPVIAWHPIWGSEYEGTIDASSDSKPSQSKDSTMKDYFTYKGTNADREKIDDFYTKTDEVLDISKDLNENLLVSAMHFGFYKGEDFLQKIDVSDGSSEFDYSKLKDNVMTVSNQLIYSTVVFNNNIIKKEKEVEKVENGKKVKKKIIVYECPTSTYTIYTDIKELCKDGVAVYKDGPGDIDFTSADMCQNLVSDDNIKDYKSDENFNPNMKCVSVNYETNTNKSDEKYQNFLRYALIPEKYYDKTISYESYNWKKMLSQFSEKAADSDKYDYNIPAYEIGPGKKIDNYSELTQEEKNTINSAVNWIIALAESGDKKNNVSRHIQGEASLPLDFTMLSSPDETIQNRISGELGKFGMRIHPISKKYTMHNGIDLKKITSADPVYSLLDGVVLSTSAKSSGCGIGIKIGHDIDSDGKYDYYTRYCHLNSKLVSTGDKVMNGQQIGIMGSTGNSTGPHLHFEIHDSNDTPVDPVPYLVDIVANKSTLTNSYNNTKEYDSESLKEKFTKAINGKITTRDGAVVAAKFIVDELKTLPYFCGGKTMETIDESWFKEKQVTDSSCSDYNSTAKYGLDNNGYINWILIQSGLINKYYSNDQLLKLGDSIDNMYDSKVRIGDLAYKGNKIGIIIALDDSTATVAYMDESGIKTSTINRKTAASIFDKVISMDKMYSEG